MADKIAITVHTYHRIVIIPSGTDYLIMNNVTFISGQLRSFTLSKKLIYSSLSYWHFLGTLISRIGQPSTVNRQPSTKKSMLKNYFKIAWRNLIRDRQFTFLNLFGLSIGLACALFIWLWVSDEWNMDKYNYKRQQPVPGDAKHEGGEWDHNNGLYRRVAG